MAMNDWQQWGGYNSGYSSYDERRPYERFGTASNCGYPYDLTFYARSSRETISAAASTAGAAVFSAGSAPASARAPAGSATGSRTGATGSAARCAEEPRRSGARSAAVASRWLPRSRTRIGGRRWRGRTGRRGIGVLTSRS